MSHSKITANLKIPENCRYGCIKLLYKNYLYELDDKCYDLIDELGPRNFEAIRGNLNLIKSCLEGLAAYHNLIKCEQNNKEIPEEIIEREFRRLPVDYIAYRIKYKNEKGSISHYYIVNDEGLKERIEDHIKNINKYYLDSMSIIDTVKPEKQSTGG